MAKRYIDYDELMSAMYHEAFENDDSYNEENPLAKWESGLWIRYKLFENVMNKMHVEVINGDLFR